MKINQTLLQLKLLIFHPQKFFKSVERESDWKKPIWWYFFSIAFYFVMSVLTVPLFTYLMELFVTKFGGFVALLIYNPDLILFEWITYFFFGILSLLLLPLTQFIVTKLGGKKPLVQTVKALYYPGVVSNLFGWIPIVNFFVFFWMLYLYFKSLKFFQGFSASKTVLLFIISLIVEMLFIALAIFVLAIMLFVIFFMVGLTVA